MRAPTDRAPPEIDRRELEGPFDIIGDVHGCFEELAELLDALGYAIADHAPFAAGDERPIAAPHPDGRTAVFVGDIADRGPRNVDCWRLVGGMLEAGEALAVIGNHDLKLRRWLAGRAVRLDHGLDLTAAELEDASEALRTRLAALIDALPHHLLLDGGRLLVAHAGLPAALHGADSDRARYTAIYGVTDGSRDVYGFPVRQDWARDYAGLPTVVYGHTPLREPLWVNGTLCIDTACVFGNRLTALRWPERETVSIAARARYATSPRPL